MRGKKRSGGRSANKTKRCSELFKQSPWRLPINEDNPIEPITGEGVQTIHNGAMEILEDIGIEFINKEAQNLFRKAGCKVDGNNVRMDRNWVMEMIRKAPSKFTITPRNKKREIKP